MIGTEDGYWFAMDEGSADRIGYEFYCYGDEVETGTCKSADEMFDLFDAFVARQRKRLN